MTKRSHVNQSAFWNGALSAILLALVASACSGGSSSSPTAPSTPAPKASAATVVVKDVSATVESTGTGVIYRTVLTVSETGGRSGATIASIRLNLSNSTRSGGSTFDASEIKTTLTAGGSNLYLLNVTSDNTDRYTSVTFTVTFADGAGVPGTYTSPAGVNPITPVAAANPTPTPPSTPAPYAVTQVPTTCTQTARADTRYGFTIIQSGTVTGPGNAFLDLSEVFLGISGTTLACNSWSYSDGTCRRLSGQPETTPWSVTIVTPLGYKEPGSWTVQASVRSPTGTLQATSSVGVTCAGR